MPEVFFFLFLKNSFSDPHPFLWSSPAHSTPLLCSEMSCHRCQRPLHKNMGPLTRGRGDVSQYWAISQGVSHLSVQGTEQVKFQERTIALFPLVIYLGVGWHTCFWPKASWDGGSEGSKETPRSRVWRFQTWSLPGVHSSFELPSVLEDGLNVCWSNHLRLE